MGDDHEDHGGHGHDCGGHGGHGDDEQAAGKLKFAIGLLTITLVVEIAAGLFSHSLSLLADAGHVFMDLFALCISFAAARLARLPPTSRRTYGWHRAEILAALLNGILLVVLAIGLLHEAWERFHNPEEVLAVPMLIAAVAGLIVNIVVALRLHGGHSHDLNLSSAYLHVLGDAGASVGVIVGAVCIYFGAPYTVDSLISVLIALIIFGGAARLIMKAGHILLEGVPHNISFTTVAEAIGEVDGVIEVHDLHIWNVCSHIVTLSCHINMDWETAEEHDRAVRAVSDMLWHRFSIMHSTIQVDYEHCGNSVVGDDMKHPTDAHEHHHH